MNGKTFLKALGVKMKQTRHFAKKVTRSYVSLFLILILGVTTTIAWFTEREQTHINSGALEFQSASSLRINKDKFSANKITIPAFTLDEASSLDGRNIYFPLGASFTANSKTPSKEETANMFFREGNAGDRIIDTTANNGKGHDNTSGHYVYRDFELKGTSGNTPVYIKSYKITIGDDVYQDELKVVDSNGKPDHQDLPPDNCPLRLAFIADSGAKPVVIDPSAQVVNYVDNSDGVVSLIDDNGVPTLENSYPNYNWEAFSTYYYEHTPLFVIPGGQSLNVTLVAWLEGTLPNCQDYIGKEISIDIDIESNFAAMDTITFVDDTYPDDNVTDGYNWISKGDPIIACSYEDPYSEESPKRWKTVIMRKTKDATGDSASDTGAEWQCEIPKKAVTNISFYRLTQNNGEGQGTIYNAWHTRSNVMSIINSNINNSTWLLNGDLQSSRTYLDTSTNTYDNALIYTAVRGNGYSTTDVSSERLSPCVGYWNFTPGSGSSSSGGGSSSGGDSGSGGSSSGGSSTSCEMNVYFNVKSWVDSNMTSGSNDQLHFYTESGKNVQFTRAGSNRYSWSGSIDVGDKIVGMYLANSSGTSYYHFTLTGVYTVPNKSTQNVTFNQGDDDKVSYN